MIADSVLVITSKPAMYLLYGPSMHAWLPAQCACAVLGGVARIDIVDDVEAVPHVNAIPSQQWSATCHMVNSASHSAALQHGRQDPCVCMLPYTLDI